MDRYLILTIIFFSTTLFLSFFVWGTRSLAIKLFGSIKNWFLRNKGYGNIYIYMPGNRLTRHFVPFSSSDSQVEINNKRYTIIPEKMFYDDLGVNSLMYYLNDTEPLTPKEKDKSDNMIRSSSYWSNLASMIKVFAELKASKKISIVLTLLIFVIVLLIIVVSLQGYLIYSLTSEAGGVIPI